MRQRAVAEVDVWAPAILQWAGMAAAWRVRVRQAGEQHACLPSTSSLACEHELPNKCNLCLQHDVPAAARTVIHALTPASLCEKVEDWIYMVSEPSMEMAPPPWPAAVREAAGLSREPHQAGMGGEHPQRAGCMACVLHIHMRAMQHCRYAQSGTEATVAPKQQQRSQQHPPALLPMNEHCDTELTPPPTEMAPPTFWALFSMNSQRVKLALEPAGRMMGGMAGGVAHAARNRRCRLP